MTPTDRPQADVSAALAALPDADRSAVAGLWSGTLGVTVRCVPTRRTVRVGDGATTVFGKWRVGRGADARNEWRWLAELPQLGLPTPEPLVWLGDAERSLLVTRAAPGRSLQDWALRALAEGWGPELVRYACAEVAPRVRRLHDARLVYRDLYWNHVFCSDPRGPRDGAASPPTFLDVERVLRPRWRWRRWLVKDLAGLLASAPPALRRRAALRFLRAYRGGSLAGCARLIDAVERKAARILAHQPKYG